MEIATTTRWPERFGTPRAIPEANPYPHISPVPHEVRSARRHAGGERGFARTPSAGKKPSPYAPSVLPSEASTVEGYAAPVRDRFLEAVARSALAPGARPKGERGQ